MIRNLLFYFIVNFKLKISILFLSILCIYTSQAAIFSVDLVNEVTMKSLVNTPQLITSKLVESPNYKSKYFAYTRWTFCEYLFDDSFDYTSKAKGMYFQKLLKTPRWINRFKELLWNNEFLLMLNNSHSLILYKNLKFVDQLNFLIQFKHPITLNNLHIITLQRLVESIKCKNTLLTISDLELISDFDNFKNTNKHKIWLRFLSYFDKAQYRMNLSLHYCLDSQRTFFRDCQIQPILANFEFKNWSEMFLLMDQKFGNTIGKKLLVNELYEGSYMDNSKLVIGTTKDFSSISEIFNELDTV